MVFSSIIFLFLFLPLVLAGYFLLKIEYRNIFLLIVSLAFYMVAKPKFILVLLTSIMINYVMGLCISYSKKNCFNYNSQSELRVIILL